MTRRSRRWAPGWLVVAVILLFALAVIQQWQLARSFHRASSCLDSISQQAAMALHDAATLLSLVGREPADTPEGEQILDRAQGCLVAAAETLDAAIRLLPAGKMEAGVFVPNLAPSWRGDFRSMRLGAMDTALTLENIERRYRYFEGDLPQVDWEFLLQLASLLEKCEHALLQIPSEGGGTAVGQLGEDLQRLHLNYEKYGQITTQIVQPPVAINSSQAEELARAAARAWIEDIMPEDGRSSLLQIVASMGAKPELRGDYWRGVVFWRVNLGVVKVDIDADEGRVLALAMSPDAAAAAGSTSGRGPADAQDAALQGRQLLHRILRNHCDLDIASAPLRVEVTLLEAAERAESGQRRVPILCDQASWWPDGLSVAHRDPVWYIKAWPVMGAVENRADTLELWLRKTDGLPVGFTAYHWGTTADPGKALKVQDVLRLFNAGRPDPAEEPAVAQLAVIWSEITRRPVLVYMIPADPGSSLLWLVNAVTGKLEGMAHKPTGTLFKE